MVDQLQNHYPGTNYLQSHIGDSTTPLADDTVDLSFDSKYISSIATSGTSRVMYERLYLDGAGLTGEALRAFTTVRAACTTAHGAHISLSFAGTATGTLSGLGAAVRATLQIPNDAAWTSGTLTAIEAEIFADGSNSDCDGCTEVSFIRVNIGGTQAAIDKIEDEAFLLSVQGLTSGSGSVFKSGTTLGTTGVGTLKIKIGSTTGYIPVINAQAS